MGMGERRHAERGRTHGIDAWEYYGPTESAGSALAGTGALLLQPIVKQTHPQPL